MAERKYRQAKREVVTHRSEDSSGVLDPNNEEALEMLLLVTADSTNGIRNDPVFSFNMWVSRRKGNGIVGQKVLLIPSGLYHSLFHVVVTRNFKENGTEIPRILFFPTPALLYRLKCNVEAQHRIQISGIGRDWSLLCLN